MIKRLILFLAIVNKLYGQSFERNVISSQGGYFSNSDFDLSWTLGEVITDTYSAAPVFFAQGFQQPLFKPVSDTVIITEPTVFPNPTYGPLSFMFPKSDSYRLKCYDIIGQIIFEETFTTNYLKLNISNLSNAYYVFLVTNNTNDFNYRVKILKIN